MMDTYYIQSVEAGDLYWVMTAAHEALLSIYRVHELPLTQEQEQEMSC